MRIIKRRYGRLRGSDSKRAALTAELSYVLSSARMYNVTIRPAFFDALLPIGVGEISDGDTIAPDDLWVGIDRNRFFLWSFSRQHLIIPRESHLLNTGQSAPNLCKFLALVNSDGRRYLQSFDLGAASLLTYLPQVRVPARPSSPFVDGVSAGKEIGNSVNRRSTSARTVARALVDAPIRLSYRRRQPALDRPRLADCRGARLRSERHLKGDARLRRSAARSAANVARGR